MELERTDGSGNEEKAPDVKMAWPGRDPVAFFRGLIDEVDAGLGELLARRAALTRAVQGVKGSTDRDAAREREIAERMAQVAPELGPDRLGRIVHAIITESLDAARSERAMWLRDLARDVLVGGGVLDQSQDPVRHEARGPHGRSAARDLGDGDDPASGLDLDPASVAGGDDLVGADLVSRIDHDLNPVTAHTVKVLRRSDNAV